ncbi:hypothetical protein N496_19920 (plasmid) [Clostridium botulinum A2B3 87]|uniref:helix-turn-helix domain-containing protein n=1 Tax=Clostridium botulinum TaxID=1491 RepID=UPI0004A5A0DE|nr:helix-turn-helix domain-containing protein [Clostridium botulinum]KEI94403.1 hypothetical protein N496_19920 [Clostridium botulinum A2B3 87]
MLKKIKDNFANMYEGEILKLSSDEFKTLSFLRVRAGENGVLWYSKDSLREILKLGRDKINKILNNLEDYGAIIIFNAKDNKTKKNASNVYYITEYDAINKIYMTANTIEEIKTYALEIRQQKEFEYAVKNNLEPRQFLLEERLSREERKIKFYIEKPCTENQYMDPPTENQYMDPPTENQYIINNKNNLNNKKQVNNNNNTNKESVVVKDEQRKIIKNYITNNLITIDDIEAEIIINDLISIEGTLSMETLAKRIDVIKNYKGQIGNAIGMIRTAIRQKWEPKNKFQNDRFNDFEQREYNYKDLEEKLLKSSSNSEEEPSIEELKRKMLSAKDKTPFLDD